MCSAFYQSSDFRPGRRIFKVTVYDLTMLKEAYETEVLGRTGWSLLPKLCHTQRKNSDIFRTVGRGRERLQVGLSEELCTPTSLSLPPKPSEATV